MAAGETRFERLQRIVLYSTGLLAAPSASDETGETMGSLVTTEGRRSARLTSTTGAGDGNMTTAQWTAAVRRSRELRSTSVKSAGCSTVFGQRYLGL